jgi:ABC-type multidrug transport system ATPase subunit
MLQEDQVELAEKTVVLFTKDGDQHNNLYDMQCMWYELASGDSYFRQSSLGRALKKYLAVEKHYADMTVKKTIFYSALLRLPRTQSNDQKIQRAHEITSALCLEKSQNTMVGGLFIQGIFGGERKRVCIALDIFTNPSILFSDEPTPCLDSTISLRIIDIAKSLSKNGMTVVMAIHQPSPTI